MPPIVAPSRVPVPVGAVCQTGPLMIVYALKCTHDHRFDVWFRSGEDCERQLAAGLVQCPSCGDGRIDKAPMAPRIQRGGKMSHATPPDGGMSAPPAAAAPDAAAATGVLPAAPVAPAGAGAVPAPLAAEIRTLLRELRRQVEASATYVGKDFAREARKIHYGEADGRPIYGEATDREADDLADEGIAFSRIPWVERDN